MFMRDLTPAFPFDTFHDRETRNTSLCLPAILVINVTVGYDYCLFAQLKNWIIYCSVKDFNLEVSMKSRNRKDFEQLKKLLFVLTIDIRDDKSSRIPK